MITKPQCLPFPSDMTDKVCVIRADALGARWQKPKFQLVRVTGGFGCKLENTGSKVFGTTIADGENWSGRRSDFIGEASPELISECLADLEGELPLDPTQMMYLAIGDGAWGKGDTLEAAKKVCKRAGGKPRIAYHCHVETWVGDFAIHWPDGAPEPVRVWGAE